MPRPFPAILSLLACLAPGGAGAEPPSAEGAPAEVPLVLPTPGAPTLSLAAAVREALERGFGILDAADAVEGARWNEKTSAARFFPAVVPVYQRSKDLTVFGVDLSQALPWTGGSVSASGRYLSEPARDAPFAKTADFRLLVSQPLLRGFGPNASLFDLRNARRARAGQERSFALARQRLAVDVAGGFFAVVAQRQLLEVTRQSLARTDALLRASNARLEVGMASKLDVFRAELQRQQAQDAVLRAEASLATALERFRATLARPPADPVEPEAAALPRPAEGDVGPAEALVARALASRLEILEARDRLHDAERAAALASQNLLPQVAVNVGVSRVGYGTSLGGAWSAGDRRVEVFLSGSVPLPLAAERAARAVARMEAASRERAVRRVEIDVEQEVRQAVRGLELARKSALIQTRAVEVAESQRRLAVLRYERGLGSNFDVVDAEGSLVSARSALVQLLTGYAVARLDLARATGALDVESEFAP